MSKELGLESSSRRDSNEHIGANQGFLEGTLICGIGELFFLGVHALCSALKYNTFGITDNNVLFLNTIGGHKTETCNARSTSSIKNNFYRVDLFSSNVNRVDESS